MNGADFLVRAENKCERSSMSSVQEVLEAAQTLPAGERAWLIQALWDTMDTADWVAPGEDWIAEAHRRSQLLDRGEMAVSSWSEVRERARRAAGLNG
jgi:putative addiction module component (TIGR02574 family)